MERAYAVRIEEVLGDDCRCAIDCFTNLDESYAYRFVNNATRTGRNHHFLDIGHCDIDHGHRPITLGCWLGIVRHLGDNRCLVADDPMTVNARYFYYGRIDARPCVSSSYETLFGKLGQLSFG